MLGDTSAGWQQFRVSTVLSSSKHFVTKVWFESRSTNESQCRISISPFKSVRCACSIPIRDLRGNLEHQSQHSEKFQPFLRSVSRLPTRTASVWVPQRVEQSESRRKTTAV